MDAFDDEDAEFLNLLSQPISVSNESKVDIVACNSNDSDDEDELSEFKKDLSKEGKQLELLLKKKAFVETEHKAYKSLSKIVQETMPVRKPKPIMGMPEISPKKAVVSHYDSFFKLKVKTPKVSSDMFDSLCEGICKQRLHSLKPENASKDGFVTMGVLVDKSDVRRSSNGNEYIIWRLHDLKDCQLQPIKCLLFGEAFKAHHKVLTGVVIALVNPQFGDTDSKDKSGVVLKALRPSQLVEIGWSMEYGKCKGITAAGATCNNFVNISASDFCVYHVVAQAKKLSANRGTFGALGSLGPVQRKPKQANQGNLFLNPAQRAYAPLKKYLTPQASNSAAIDKLSAFSPAEEKRALQNVISARASLFGARNFIKSQQTSSSSSPTVTQRTPTLLGSMKTFFDTQEKEETLQQKEKLYQARVNALKCEERPKLGPEGYGYTAKKSNMDEVRARAAAILKRDREAVSQGLKRKAPDGASGSAKKRCAEEDTTQLSQDELAKIANHDSLLTRKSKFSKAAAQAENDAVNRYLTSLEPREKVETFMTSTMVVREVDVVTCKACNYTALKQSELCKSSDHVVSRHKAAKRFFKCNGCKRRTIAFGRLPKKHCDNCGETDWQPVAMKDERRTDLDRKKLLIRGDEQKYL